MAPRPGRSPPRLLAASHGPAVLLLLLLLLAPARAGSAIASRSWWPEVPWCVKCVTPPNLPQGVNPCKHHELLDKGAAEKGWRLIDFPLVSPLHPEQWPNRPGDQEVLRQCKYIAFSTLLLDGLGSQYQRILWLVTFAMKYNLTYIDVPLVSVKPQVDIAEAHSLFNLGYGFTPLDQIPDGVTICLAERCGPHRSLDAKPAIAEKVRRGVFADGPLTGFDWKKVIVAIHIRRGDVGDVIPNESRWEPEAIFIALMRNISSTLDALREGRDSYEFHIFSEGKVETTFASLSKAVADLPVVYHLNGDPLRAIRGIMCSDIFVMAQSSFSFISADFLTSATTITVEPWQGWCAECHDALTPERLPWTLYGLQQRADGRQYLGGC